MKQVWKVGSIFIALLVLWISLLLTKDLPPSLQLIVPYFPMYAIASLGCYGLGALGYGMMVFRVCPEEADLLQKVFVLLYMPLAFFLFGHVVSFLFHYIPFFSIGHEEGHCGSKDVFQGSRC